jgi:hypothetical protein
MIKNLSIKLFIFILAVVVFSPLQSVFAQTTCPPGQLCYVPLEPIAGVSNNTDANSLPLLLDQIFMILFSLGGLLAVVMLTLGGIQYMVSTVSSAKNEGKRRAEAAIYGILILAGSYLILNTINPDLTRLKLTIPHIAEQESPGNTAQQVSQNTGSVTCKYSATTGSTMYATNSPCANAITVKLNQLVNGNNGVALKNTSQGSAVLVLDPSVPVTSGQSGAAISQFNTSCQNAGGDVENWPPAPGSGATYICLVDRTL